jgi:hypothetical protein
MDRFTAGENLSAVSLRDPQNVSDLIKLLPVDRHFVDNLAIARRYNTSPHHFLLCYRPCCDLRSPPED